MRTPITLALSAILLTVACSQDGPTDVQRKTPAPAVVGAPSFAVGGNKPVSGYEIKKDSLDAAVGGQAIVEVYCPTGKRALGGGFKVGGGAVINDADVAIYESAPRVTLSGQTDGWRVEAMNRTTTVRNVQAWVICAPI
jgi:hypothetical protein